MRSSVEPLAPRTAAVPAALDWAAAPGAGRTTTRSRWTMQTPCSSSWPAAQRAAAAVASAVTALAGATLAGDVGIVADDEDAAPKTAAPAMTPKAAPVMTVVRARRRFMVYSRLSKLGDPK